MSGKFELKKSSSGQFMFNLKAGNGRVVLTSELSRTKASAQDSIKAVKKFAAKGANFERKTSAKGEPFFVLKAANGEIIGTSEMYTSAASMNKGIASVQTHAQTGTLTDLTE